MPIVVGKFMRGLLFAGCLSLAAASGKAEDEKFLCSAEQATGFKLNAATGSWDRADFDVKRRRFILRRPNAEELRIQKSQWVATEVEGDLDFATCLEDFNQYGYVICRGMEDLRFNRQTLRYLRGYLFGYFNHSLKNRRGESLGEEAPYLEIGKCVRL